MKDITYMTQIGTAAACYSSRLMVREVSMKKRSNRHIKAEKQQNICGVARLPIIRGVVAFFRKYYDRSSFAFEITHK